MQVTSNRYWKNTSLCSWILNQDGAKKPGRIKIAERPRIGLFAAQLPPTSTSIFNIALNHYKRFFREVARESVTILPTAWLYLTYLPAFTSQAHDQIMASVASLLCPHQNRKVSLLPHGPNTSWIIAPKICALLLTWHQRCRGPTNKCQVKQDIHPATPT